MKYDYINKEKNVPSYLLNIDSFLSKFPSFGSLFGMCLYSFVIYILMLLIRLFCRKPYKEEDDFALFEDEDKKDIEEIKKRREKLLKDPNFKKKLEENRKRKAKEAIELLNKISN